tara:strand:+ start:1131 stop:1505 length:375 start_codon:yes stop_codon:yes gene_type:complete
MYLIFENNNLKLVTTEDPNSSDSIIILNENSVVKEVADDFVIEYRIITLVDNEINSVPEDLVALAQSTILPMLRFERDNRLKETDIWGLQDYPASSQQLAYRQALRDITDSYNSLDTVVWPTKP